VEARHGRDENLRSAQQALAHRARCKGAASRGMYTEEMEAELAGVGTPAHRREGHDD
jgi:fructose-bisphosphate aldolase, class I